MAPFKFQSLPPDVMADARPLEGHVSPDREMERVLRTAPVESFRIDDPFDTRLARWKHNPFHDVVHPMSDHVIMTYLGAMQRLERRSGKAYATGMGRQGSITFIPAGSTSRWDIHGPMDIVQLYLSPDLLDRVARECPGEGRSLVEYCAAGQRDGDPAYDGASVVQWYQQPGRALSPAACKPDRHPSRENPCRRL